MLVVYNPKAGNGRGQKIANRFREFLKARGLEARFEVSATDREATIPLAKEESLVIIGGDGTFNEAINQLDYQGQPVGFIPSGTGNDFVKMLSIGRNEQEYFATATSDHFRAIDIGSCNGRKFLNGVGVGFDGQIVAEMQKHRKWLSGQAAYYYEVLRILSTYRERHFQFSLDGSEREEQLILMTIGNGSTFGGGFKLTPHADLSDGLLDVCEIGSISPLRRYLNVPKLQKGSHDQLKEVKMHQIKELTIEANPMLNAHIDGEFLGNPPFHIKVLPRYLKVRG